MRGVKREYVSATLRRICGTHRSIRKILTPSMTCAFPSAALRNASGFFADYSVLDPSKSCGGAFAL
jgi:hypothetical protein